MNSLTALIARLQLLQRNVARDMNPKADEILRELATVEHLGWKAADEIKRTYRKESASE